MSTQTDAKEDKEKRLVSIMGNIRLFDTGATRDSDDSKFDFEGYLSPLVLERFAEYMTKHRKQSDGSLRDSDNWQKGFGPNHKDVCIKSLWRHFMDLWKIHRGREKLAEASLEDTLCAVMFNTMAYFHKVLEDKYEKM